MLVTTLPSKKESRGFQYFNGYHSLSSSTQLHSFSVHPISPAEYHLQTSTMPVLKLMPAMHLTIKSSKIQQIKLVLSKNFNCIVKEENSFIMRKPYFSWEDLLVDFSLAIFQIDLEEGKNFIMKISAIVCAYYECCIYFPMLNCI